MAPDTREVGICTNMEWESYHFAALILFFGTGVKNITSFNEDPENKKEEEKGNSADFWDERKIRQQFSVSVFTS